MEYEPSGDTKPGITSLGLKSSRPPTVFPVHMGPSSPRCPHPFPPRRKLKAGARSGLPGCARRDVLRILRRRGLVEDAESGPEAERWGRGGKKGEGMGPDLEVGGRERGGGGERKRAARFEPHAAP